MKVLMNTYFKDRDEGRESGEEGEGVVRSGVVVAGTE